MQTSPHLGLDRHILHSTKRREANHPSLIPSALVLQYWCMNICSNSICTLWLQNQYEQLLLCTGIFSWNWIKYPVWQSWFNLWFFTVLNDDKMHQYWRKFALYHLLRRNSIGNNCAQSCFTMLQYSNWYKQCSYIMKLNDESVKRLTRPYHAYDTCRLDWICHFMGFALNKCLKYILWWAPEVLNNFQQFILLFRICSNEFWSENVLMTEKLVQSTQA